MLFSNLFVWSRVYSSNESELRVYFLDVGQGDAILIESPTQGRVLIDGGPDRKVLSELGRVLPFGDRRIDVVIESHPDADHITGLVEVMNRFDVDTFVSTGMRSTNSLDETLDEVIQEKEINKIQAKRGVSIDLGGGAVLTILYPSGSIEGLETNEASIVSKLTLGEMDFILTGDSTKLAEYKLLSLNKELLDSEVLQVGHHGSDTSSSLLYVQAVSPEYSVISSGKDNRYGHPHKVTLDTLNKIKTNILNTADVGRILFKTDGEKLEVEY